MNTPAATRARRPRPDPVARRYRVQVLDRTIGILQTVCDANADLAAVDIARQLGLHKSTVHRLLVVLEHYHLIKKGPGGAYRLGTRLIELGDCAGARLNLSERSAPFLQNLAKETGEGAHVMVLSGTEMLSIAHVEGRWKLQSLSRTGQRVEMHCTAAGKSVLAYLPDEACDELIAKLPLKRRTSRTIVKPSALRMELVHVRNAGWAVDDEEYEDGLRCVGAPIFDHQQRVIASVSMAAPVFRLQKDRLPEVARIVMAAARGISADLGNRTAQDFNRDSRARTLPAQVRARR